MKKKIPKSEYQDLQIANCILPKIFEKEFQKLKNIQSKVSFSSSSKFEDILLRNSIVPAAAAASRPVV